MNVFICKFKKIFICNCFLYLKLYNVYCVRILYIYVYLVIDKNCYIYNLLCNMSICFLESCYFEVVLMLFFNCLIEVVLIIIDGIIFF